MNTTTPRVFIAATRQNDGKTTASLGLIAALQQRYPRVGYIKPVGQRFVEIEEHKIDEDTVLMDSVYRLNCPLVDMSPIAVEPDFTRKYLQSSNNEASNAQIAKILRAKVIIVTQGGIGKPIDEVSLNRALFEQEGVEVIGVIINKVIGSKLDYISDFARRGFKRKGLELLGVIAHERILSSPTMDAIREELRAELLGAADGLRNLVDDVVVGAMGAENAMSFFKPGVLLITPGDREDILRAAGASLDGPGTKKMAGIVLTGNLRPGPAVLKLIRAMPIPVLLAAEDSYLVASKVHDLTVKTRPGDSEKISLIRDLIAKNVNVQRILEAL